MHETKEKLYQIRENENLEGKAKQSLIKSRKFEDHYFPTTLNWVPHKAFTRTCKFVILHGMRLAYRGKKYWMKTAVKLFKFHFDIYDISKDRKMTMHLILTDEDIWCFLFCSPITQHII